jgi:hypothetical protein
MKSQQYDTLKNMQGQLRAILEIINVNDEVADKLVVSISDSKKSSKTLIKFQKKLLGYLTVGIDWYGIEMFRSGEHSREANNGRNKIEKICEDFDEAIDNLQKIHAHDS